MCFGGVEARRHRLRFYDNPTDVLDTAIRLVGGDVGRCVIVADAASATMLSGHVDPSVGVIDIDETAFHPARTIHRLLAGIADESSRLDAWCIISAVTPSTARGWQAWLPYEVMLNLIARDDIELHCLVHRRAVPRGLSDLCRPPIHFSRPQPTIRPTPDT